MRSQNRHGGRKGRHSRHSRWEIWFFAGVTGFACLRLLAWWRWGLEQSQLRDLAHVLAWLTLAGGIWKALQAFLDARRRHAWVAQQRSTEALRRLSWSGFERLVAAVFADEGYDVDLVGQGGADGGIDVILRRPSELVGSEISLTH